LSVDNSEFRAPTPEKGESTINKTTPNKSELSYKESDLFYTAEGTLSDKGKWIITSEPSHNIQDASDPKVTSASYKDKWIVMPEPSHNVPDLVRKTILKEVEKELYRRDKAAFDSDFYSNFINTLPDAHTGMRSIFDLSGSWLYDIFDPKGLSNDEARKADVAAMIDDMTKAHQEFINSMDDKARIAEAMIKDNITAKQEFIDSMKDD